MLTMFRSLGLACLALRAAAYRDNLAQLQQDLGFELLTEGARTTSMYAEMYDELKALEALEGDKPLFGNMRQGRFKKAAQLLEQDPTSVLSKLKAGFSTGKNMVVVGAGGVGKTESVLLALQDLGKSKEQFDLRQWYFDKVGAEDKTGYLEYAVKASQLQELKSSAQEIQATLKGKTADVIFFDEVDLGQGFLVDTELEAMKLLLMWGNEQARQKSKVVVLHPLVSVQSEVHQVLMSQGFPQPGDPTWIDFSQPYSEPQEAAMVEGILAECQPTPSQGEMEPVVRNLHDYFLGMPNAYLTFLMDKGDILQKLAAMSAAEAANAMMETAKKKVGGRLIKINVGMQAKETSRAEIKHLLDQQPVQDAWAADGAVAAMALEKRGGLYIVPPLMRDAFSAYCKDSTEADKQEITPICSTA